MRVDKPGAKAGAAAVPTAAPEEAAAGSGPAPAGVSSREGITQSTSTVGLFDAPRSTRGTQAFFTVGLSRLSLSVCTWPSREATPIDCLHLGCAPSKQYAGWFGDLLWSGRYQSRFHCQTHHHTRDVRSQRREAGAALALVSLELTAAAGSAAPSK
jgi:hypothetical protein